MATACRRLVLAPLGRCVDDFSGASQHNVAWSGGRCLDIISGLIGFACDPAKSSDGCLQMVVLGAKVMLSWALKAVSVRVDDEKAARWAASLENALDAGVLDPGDAAKAAGRLSFAVTVAADRVGRAYIRALHAQASAPLPGNRMSTWLRMALAWWLAYLLERPVVWISVYRESRPHLRTWTDASGADRWIAAVLECKGQWLYTRMQTPQIVWAQLLERRDNQIGLQELLAIVLALGTFPNWLTGSLWSTYCDNDGVLGAVLRGGSAVADANLIVGKLWLEVARMQISLYLHRVESKANIADGPTRYDFGMLEELGAQYVVPVLPEWMCDLWRVPSLADL